MDNFAHLVEIDEGTQKLTIYRVDPKTDQRALYTSVKIPSKRIHGNDREFREFARMLGENLLIDSPSARRLLGL
jgi:hypothetical protein